MLLVKVTLKDLGIYKDTNEFDLSTTPDKPIVLYGGRNGDGKTTLFESIPMCLYGQDYCEPKITKKQYHEKIYKLFHRDHETRTRAQEAFVELEFQYAQNGIITNYKIKRAWQNNDGKVEEFLSVHEKTGDADYVPTRIDKEQYQHLINNLIPKNISQMFFFNGERIESMAESGNEDIYIKESFDNLLGLDTPAKLYDDIGLYILRNSDDEADAILAEIEHKTKEKESLQNKLGNIKEKSAFLTSEINNKSKELEILEKEFFEAGGIFAQNRKELRKAEEAAIRDITPYEDGLREMVEDRLALAIVPDLLKQVQEKIESDISRTKAVFEKENLGGCFDAIRESFAAEIKSYDKEISAEILAKLEQVMERYVQSRPSVEPAAFGFSSKDANHILARIEYILAKKFDGVTDHRKDYLDCRAKLSEISAKMDVLPRQDEVGPLYSKIKAITREIGEMDQELQTLANLEAQQKSLIVLLNSQIRKCLDNKKFNSRKNRGLELAPKIQDVLKDYSKRLRSKKIEILESNILEGFRKCFHKKDFVARVSIDPDTYSLTMYKSNGDIRTREELSKGELQVYVTGITWGLAKTSGRPLPFVIDTPLSRLDREHRANMVTEFYPTASHQMIIFSTNTEIVDEYYESLKPHLSHVQLIQQNAKKNEYFESNGGMA